MQANLAGLTPVPHAEKPERIANETGALQRAKKMRQDDLKAIIDESISQAQCFLTDARKLLDQNDRRALTTAINIVGYLSDFRRQAVL